jgi:hypothetical protein
MEAGIECLHDALEVALAGGDIRLGVIAERNLARVRAALLALPEK